MVPCLKSAHNEVVSGVVRRENPLFFRATILGAAGSARPDRKALRYCGRIPEAALEASKYASIHFPERR
jgi:hypothetical protein